MTAPAPRLPAFAGSLRDASHNRRPDVHACAAVLTEGARAAGAEVSLIELRDYPLPVHDGDIEVAGIVAASPGAAGPAGATA